MTYHPTICIITPTIGRPTLIRTLESGALEPGDLWFVVQDSKNGDDITGVVYDYITSRPLNPHWLYPLFPPYTLGGDYGNSLRDYAMFLSTCDYFIFLDDDDILAPNAIRIIKRTIAGCHPRPIIFKMINGNGELLWRTRDVTPGNVGGSMFCCPNTPGKLGKWANGAGHRSDFEFIRGTLKKYGDSWRQQLVWSGDVIIHCRPEGYKNG